MLIKFAFTIATINNFSLSIFTGKKLHTTKPAKEDKQQRLVLKYVLFYVAVFNNKLLL